MQFLRFCLVGSVGFLVDAGVLLAGLWAGVDPLAARGASIITAGAATWVINRRWTFAVPPNGPLAKAREGMRYAVVQVGGATVNYAIFAAVITGFGISAQTTVFGLGAGSTTGLFVNFLGPKFLAFRSGAP